MFAFVGTVVLTVTFFILACTHSLREFMEQFPYLSKRELGSIAADTRHQLQESSNHDDV